MKDCRNNIILDALFIMSDSPCRIMQNCCLIPSQPLLAIIKGDQVIGTNAADICEHMQAVGLHKTFIRDTGWPCGISFI